MYIQLATGDVHHHTLLGVTGEPIPMAFITINKPGEMYTGKWNRFMIKVPILFHM